MLSVDENSKLSARQNNMSRITVLKDLHKEVLYPFKLTFVQDLTCDYPDRRMGFCDRMLNKLKSETILFSDESILTLNEAVN